MNVVTAVPKVSIIIPFYNCPYVHIAVQSALNQTYQNKEIIVVDDGSTKNVAKLEPYLHQIKYIKKENGGTASALNLGIKQASGDYFTWLSSDDVYHPRKVGKQLSFMIDQKANVSYGAYYLIDSHGKKIGERKQGISFPTREQFIQKMRTGCFINGCTVMMKTDLFQEVGLFNEQLRCTQDYDMWLRVMQKYEFHYLDEPLVYYRVHDLMGSKTLTDVQKKEINVLKRRYFIPIKQLLRRGV